MLIIVLIIAGVTHAHNMFNFPFFENDEGTYMAQAWSFLTEGKLAPYTYWYDHAPAGWIFTSLWIFLTGGLFTFGFSLNSGRIFMLLLHVASTFFLYKITKKMTKQDFAAVIATLIFSFSPLAVYFQRRLLLDNIMTFWLLFSIFLIYVPKKKLSWLLLSAITFAISVLTKENAIFFLPVLLYFIYIETDTHNRTFAIFKWLILCGGIISLYPLYALLKAELFPYGSFFSPPYEHVSLLGTLKAQASRGTGLPFWVPGSDFRDNVEYWFTQDKLLIISGFMAFIINLILAFFKKENRQAFILTLPIVLFLISGKLVINFYVIPLIPFFALCIAVLLSQMLLLLKKVHIAAPFIAFTIIVIVSGKYYIANTKAVFSKDETGKQIEAVNWIKENLEPDSNISIDFYSYLDLSESRFEGDPTFDNAEWFWKVELDPDIRDKKFSTDPEKLDYVMVTAEVQRQLKGYSEDISLLRNFLKNATITKEFANESDFNFKLKLFDQDYPNGDWVVLYRKTTSNDYLQSSWKYYKQRFIVDRQYTVDPANNLTTSEGQSYALLRAVWMNDQETFDSVWNWTKEHMQNGNKIFAWKYEDGAITDKGTATDADTDIALALIFASKQWHDQTYLVESQEVLQGIWENEVSEFDGRSYILPGDWAQEKETLITNPSYLSPYAYKIFAEVDQDHNWHEIVYTSYNVLEKCMNANFGDEETVHLPPNWCAFDTSLNAVASTEEGLQSTDYSYDAIRTMWRLALDYIWYQDPRAKDLLELSSNFLAQKWIDDQKIVVGYTYDGRDWEQYESVLGYAINLSNFVVTNTDIADSIYEIKIADKFYEDFDAGKHYWEDPNNYYTQNWAWFGTALYSDHLPNLWKK